MNANDGVGHPEERKSLLLPSQASSPLVSSSPPNLAVLIDSAPIGELDLQQELDANASRSSLVRQLLEMGFTDHAAIDCASLYAGHSICEAVEFLLADKDPNKHVFLSSGDEPDQCAVCRRSMADHHLLSTTDGLRVTIGGELPEFKARESNQHHEFDEVKVPVVIFMHGELCGVCFCEHEPPEMSSFTCGHRYCRECCRNWLKARIEDGKVGDNQIFCIESDCRLPISPEIIQTIADDELYQKYQRFRKQRAVDRDSNLRWCPSPGCDTPLVQGRGFLGRKVLRSQCVTCNSVSCFKCGREYHGENSCEGHLEDMVYSWAAEENTRRCPACRKIIVKLEGCNHMTCSCGYEFCWLCGGKYSRNHYRGWNLLGCPGQNYSTRQPLCPRGCRDSCCGRALYRLMATLFMLVMFLLVLVGQILYTVTIGLFLVTFGCCLRVCCCCCDSWREVGEDVADYGKRTSTYVCAVVGDI